MVVTTPIGAVTALVSIILHYTNKGDDVFGCRSETLQMAGKFNTNKYCTREVAACNFLPKYLSKSDKGSAALGCAEAVSLQRSPRDYRSRFKITVKWLQIALIFLALLILNLFAVQAWLRRKTRPTRMTAAGKEPMSVDSNERF